MNALRLPLAALCLTLISSPCLALELAVDMVNADYMWQEGYTGDGVEIGVIDLHLADPAHPAINGNHLGTENFAVGASWFGSHATAVAGAALSQDPTRRGVAYEAGWWSGQTTNRVGILPDRDAIKVSAESFAQGLGILDGNPAEVISISIGLNDQDNATDQWSLALDHIASTLGTTVVVAAGNDGPTSSSFTGPPGTAFNILSVGATGGTGSVVSEDYGQIAPYSSRGPTSDGRSKPDIVAPGSLIELPTLGGAWTVTSGTSFAAPIVAGGAALLVDMGFDRGFDVDAKIIKSVLMNSADKLAGWSHSPTSPLDSNFGSGQMNLESAFFQYDAGEQEGGIVGPIGWDHGTLQGAIGNTYEIGANIPSGVEISATLVWNREVTTDVEDIESATYTATNFENLDLFLYDVNDLATPVASSISSLDNVEHLFLSIPSEGAYVLEVRSAGGAIVDPLPYSLAWHVEVPDIVQLGDTDMDGDVDDVDLSAIFGNFTGTNPSPPNPPFMKTQADGDTDGDGDVDDLDLGNAFGNFTGALDTASAMVVPEPSTIVLAALALLGVVGCGRRRRKQEHAGMPGQAIRRADLDGTNVEDLIRGQQRLEDIVLDIRNQHMYWSNGETIKRADFDGTNRTTIIRGLTTAQSLALDLTIPEPSTLSICAGAFISLVRFGWRRRKQLARS